MGNVRIIFRLLHYVKKYKVKLVYLIILSLISIGFEVLKPLPVKYIIDNVLSGNPVPSFLTMILNIFTASTDKISLLIFCIIAMIVLINGSAGISLLSSHLTTKVCQRMVHDFSVDLFDKLQRLTLTFYSKNKVGDLLQRLSGDVYIVYSLVAQILLPSITSIGSLIAMFYVMARINLELAFIAISVVPALGLVLYFFNKPMSDLTIKQYSLLGELSSFTQQSLSSIKIIQAYAKEKYVSNIFRNQSDKYSHAFINSTKISVTYVILTSVITGLAGAVVIGVGAFKSFNGAISIGDLFVFIGYISALFGPVNSLSSTVGTAVTLSARGKRIFELFDSSETVDEKKGAVELNEVKGNIELQNVNFGYGKEGESKIILKDFNLKIPAGKIVAIIGPTGAGKSSLISLLLRFYDPWNGKILFDSVDLHDIKLSSLRNNISLVLQDSFIFPVSIEENISFGNPEASKKDIIEAAKSAQAHEFIMKLPEGYNTIPSESGVSLSGGERQRISLARAFLRKAPVLILDEPTSALDVQTEAKIFEAISRSSEGRTLIIISHRLSTIRNADLIVTLKDGRIVEQGTHNSLLSEKNIYADLYKLHGSQN